MRLEVGMIIRHINGAEWTVIESTDASPHVTTRCTKRGVSRVPSNHIYYTTWNEGIISYFARDWNGHPEFVTEDPFVTWTRKTHNDKPKRVHKRAHSKSSR